MKAPLYIGTAGWSIPKQLQHLFTGDDSHLARYSKIFNAVEINSSFYREHKPETYEKWANTVPDQFRFSVKLSRYFTQEKRLTETGSRLKETLEGISGLKEKWGALLVQLPPSLDFDSLVATRFLEGLRENFEGTIAWEPRHKSWASAQALELLSAFEISKVLADPEPCEVRKDQRLAVELTRYLRLHGTPQIYKSKYSEEMISRVAKLTSKRARPAWCIFDNTTFGFATENALQLKDSFSVSP